MVEVFPLNTTPKNILLVPTDVSDRAGESTNINSFDGNAKRFVGGWSC